MGFRNLLSRLKGSTQDYWLTGITAGQEITINWKSSLGSNLQLVNLDTGELVNKNEYDLTRTTEITRRRISFWNRTYHNYYRDKYQLSFTPQEGANYALRTSNYSYYSTTPPTTNYGNLRKVSSISEDQTVKGYLSSYSDTMSPTRPNTYTDDYVLKNVSAGQRVQINLNAKFDTYLEIVEAKTGKVIKSDNNGGKGSNSQINFTIPDSQTYLVRATSHGQRKTGSYTLDISDPTEINGKLEYTDEKNPLRNGRLYDDFRLNSVMPGAKVELELESSNIDTYLQLIDAKTGQLIGSNNDYGGSKNSKLAFTAKDGIDYTVRATSYSSNDTGEYTLNTNFGDLSEIKTERESFSLDFSTKKQSMWHTSSFSTQDSKFLGDEWQGKKTNTKLMDVWGHKLYLNSNTDGKIGLQSTFATQGGHINAKLPVDVWLDIPSDVRPGEKVTIRTGHKLSKNASFETFSPSVSYDLDLIYEMDAYLQFKAGNQKSSVPKKTALKKFDLLDFDGTEGYSKSIFNGMANIGVKLPKIDTESQFNTSTRKLSASGTDSFLEASWDLDAMVTNYLGSPPLEGSKEKNLGVFKFGAGYNLIDAEVATDLTFSQEFDLGVDELTGQLTIENGKKVDFTVGENITFIVPHNIGDSLDIDATVNMGAKIRNQTDLGYDVDFDLRALSGYIEGKVDLYFKDWAFARKSFGPVLDESYDLFSGKIANLYNREFNLGGFNSQSFDLEIDVV